MTRRRPAVPDDQGRPPAAIVDLVTQHEVRSQTELADLLAAQRRARHPGHLSRDLVELDAVKVRSASGALVYAVPAEGGDRTPARPATRRPAPRSRLARLLRRAAGQRRRERQPGGPAHAARAPPSSSPPPSTGPSCPTCSAPSPATTPCW